MRCPITHREILKRSITWPCARGTLLQNATTNSFSPPLSAPHRHRREFEQRRSLLPRYRSCYHSLTQPKHSKTRPALHRFLTVLAILILLADLTRGRGTPLAESELPFVGPWHTANGKGSHYLFLRSDGSYRAEASMCLGWTGTETGTWQAGSTTLRLNPRFRVGSMQKIQTMLITNVQNQIYLLKTNQFALNLFSDRGPNPASCFRLVGAREFN